MWTLQHNLKVLTFVISILIKRDPRSLILFAFIRYVSLNFKRLIDMQLRLRTVSHETLRQVVDARAEHEHYIDPFSCALGNPDLLKQKSPSWQYLCCTDSLKRYKILVVPSTHVESTELLLLDTTLFNVQNFLGIGNADSNKYFILTVPDFEHEIAHEVAVSLVSNPFDCSNDLVDTSLRNYFDEPRYLRNNDLFSIDIKLFAPSHQYLLSHENFKRVLFKVRELSGGDANDGCFVLRGETALIQKPHIHSYLPSKHELEFGKFDVTCEKKISSYTISNCPPLLQEPLLIFQACISPFIQRDTLVDIRPIFLLKGPKGSGKSKLVRIAADRAGLHVTSIDFCEIQSLTSAQTEAKLRIVLQNAKNCVPCILLLNNIQIFGKDAEGKEDERIISSFAFELKNLYKSESAHPLVVVATADDSDISVSLQQIFIETIYMKSPDPNERLETMEWLLKVKGFRHQENLISVAASCTDFVLEDLNALIMHAAKIRYNLSTLDERSVPLTLTQSDFSDAREYLQSRYSDFIGAPKLPKVYWEDIGGLADLKSEIIRRIELPLLTSASAGLTRSGLLLYGPPGTGKTLLAKAVATECKVHFLSVKGPELLNMYVGQSEKNVRQVFERARTAAPCVIFFDELDSLAPNRGKNGDSGGVMDRVVSQLLAEIDGVDNSGSIFIIGATNRPDLIDPALLRPGRFDKLLYVGISSDKKSQLSVLKALAKNFRLSENGRELEEVVESLAENLTGADMYAICSNAWLSAVRRNLTETKADKSVNDTDAIAEDVVVTKEDFIKAARELTPSVSAEELKRYEQIRLNLDSTIR